MTILLGGDASPIGWSVQFLRASSDTVLAAVRDARADEVLDVSAPEAFPGVLQSLLPFEAPWTRELVLACGDDWTAYLNNFVNGGDSSAIGPAIARHLGIDCVVATHTPIFGPGHAQTSLSVTGPEGDPPLMYIRYLACHCEDGRWSWHEDGRAFDFEVTERYSARRKRDRFDRALLLEYLLALGIPADDDSSYGPGVRIQQVVSWPTRKETLEQAKRSIHGS